LKILFADERPAILLIHVDADQWCSLADSLIPTESHKSFTKRSISPKWIIKCQNDKNTQNLCTWILVIGPWYTIARTWPASMSVVGTKLSLNRQIKMRFVFYCVYVYHSDMIKNVMFYLPYEFNFTNKQSSNENLRINC